MAGAGGFEPPYGGIKIRCLTAWRRPNMTKWELANSFAANDPVRRFSHSPRILSTLAEERMSRKSALGRLKAVSAPLAGPNGWFIRLPLGALGRFAPRLR